MPRMFWSRSDKAKSAPHTPDRTKIWNQPREAGAARWIVPLVTLIIGAVLGALAVGLFRGGDEPAPVTAEPSPAQTVPVVVDEVAVPRACLNIADGAQELQRLIDQAMKAAGQLDAAALSGLVREIDEQQAGLRDDTVTCQLGVATATPVTPPTTVTATKTTTATQTTTATVTAEPRPAATSAPRPATTSP